ncbi:MAG: hypothetical protein ABWY04_01155, partial [Arthrobacter sp.]
MAAFTGVSAVSGVGTPAHAAPVAVKPPGAYVNIKDAPFNAVGDGAADDTAAVQAFFTHLGQTGLTGTAEGTFRLTKSIAIHQPAKPFTFRGCGAGTKFMADFKSLASVFYVKNAVETVFENFTIEGKKSAVTAHGMNLSNCQDTTVENVTVLNWGYTAIMFMWDKGLGGESLRNRIAGCTARSLDGKARNGFMLENSKSSHILNCQVYNLDPEGEPSFGLQMKNRCVNCSIIGGSVDGARAGVAFGTTTDLVAVGLMVSGVTVRNCLQGVMVDMAYGTRVDMTIDMAENPFCQHGVYIASDQSSFGTYNVTVLNIPDTGLAVMMKNTGNTVNLAMNKIGNARLVEFTPGSTLNVINVSAIGGKSDLSILQAPIIDNSGAKSGNKVTFPSLTGRLHSLDNTASILRFTSPSDTGTYIQNNHATGMWTFRSLGTDVVAFSPSALNHAGASDTATLGIPSRRWKEVYASKYFVGAVFTTSGTGSPEGVVEAPVGSEYVDTTG